MFGQQANTGSFNPLVHQPVAVQVVLTTGVAATVHRGLNSAINEIGGIGVFLFLFAKVSERKLGYVIFHPPPAISDFFHVMKSSAVCYECCSNITCFWGSH